MMNTVQPEFLGRLGNNMFQIAAAIGYAQKYGTSWSVQPGYHHRDIYQYFKPNACRHNPRKMKLYDVATDEGWGYAPIPFLEGAVRIRGFFQSYKYFEGAEDRVMDAFKLPSLPGYNDTISIHVRRGDYLEHNNDFPPINMDYINIAMSAFNSNAKFIIVSDDMKWCRENIKGANISYSDSNSALHDMAIMASCAGNVISNSTFAWWAAWLNPRPDKIVVSPSHLNWFGHNRVDTKDLLPPEWHQIKFR